MTEEDARRIADEVCAALVKAGLPALRSEGGDRGEPHIMVHSNGVGEVLVMIEGGRRWPAGLLLHKARRVYASMGFGDEVFGGPVNDRFAFVTLVPR